MYSVVFITITLIYFTSRTRRHICVYYVVFITFKSIHIEVTNTNTHLSIVILFIFEYTKLLEGYIHTKDMLGLREE